jgi:hypothetical protein
LRELGQSKRLLKFYESLNPSRRREIAKWVAECKTKDARQRRSRQITERLMETMEAERELPPIMQLAFRQNPRPPNNGSACRNRIGAPIFLLFFITALQRLGPIALPNVWKSCCSEQRRVKALKDSPHRPSNKCRFVTPKATSGA